MEVIHQSTVGTLVKTGEKVSLEDAQILHTNEHGLVKIETRVNVVSYLPVVKDLLMSAISADAGIEVLQILKPPYFSRWEFCLSTGELVRMHYSEREIEEGKIADAIYNELRDKPSYY